MTRTHSSIAPAPRRPLVPLWAALPLAVAAGVLMDLSYPDLALWPLAFVAAAALLVAVIGRSAGGALAVGLVYGLVFFGLLVSWTSRYLGPLPWLALTVLEAVLTGVMVIALALAYRWMPATGPATRFVLLPVVVAALWIGRESVLGRLPYGGFPWSRIAMTQSESPLATASSWIGVTGVGFVMVLAVAATIELARAYGIRRPLRLALPSVALVLVALVPAFPSTVVGELRVAAVQGNGPTGYFDTRAPYSVIEAQTAASEPLIGEEIDLVVWPEGSLDYDPGRDQNTARKLDLLASRLDAPLLVNAAIQRGDEYFNSSMLWQKGVAAQHDKRHPVPFGEYIPDRAFYRLLVPDLVDLVQREYSFGKNAPLMMVGESTIGLAICFDVIYDDVITEGILGGAELLVFQTNNADFRGTDENLQQLAFARMRAIETSRWVVNVSTVGTSQVIRHDGTTVSSLETDKAGALLETIERRTGLTSGVVLGPALENVLLWGGLVVLVAAGLWARRRA